MTRWLGILLLVAVVALGFVWHREGQESARADAAGEAVKAAEADRVAAQVESARDSVALDSVRAAMTVLKAQNDSATVLAVQRERGARQRADSAAVRVRAVLDSLGASTEAFDRYVAERDAELAAVADQRDLARADAVNVRTELAATNTALESERGTSRAFGVENQALRDRVTALNRKNKVATVERWILRVTVVGLVFK